MEFEGVVRSGLKLKKATNAVELETKKKKKKRDKQADEAAPRTDNSAVEKASSTSAPQRKAMKTKAELSFLEMKDKLLQKTIKEKAVKTHKQKVEEFNRHLDSLTEHFDIQKVSWTK